MKQTTINGILAASALVCTLGCPGGGGGGGGTSVYATSLVYTDPTGSGYRLVRAAESATNKLVLNLVGPSAETGRGVSFAIQADTTKARFVAVTGTELAENGSVFDLGNVPQLFKAVQDGKTLRISMAQKGNSVGAKNLDGVLAKVALQLQSSVSKGAVILSAPEATVLSASGTQMPVTIAVGSLAAQ